MILQNLKLFNIGPYKDEDNSIDFYVTKDRNIILIGGNNGSGKTTILEAIKLCLFGSYSLGFKTENNTYYDYLWKKFNYQAVSINRENSRFEIELTFIDHEDYQQNTYTISRKWILNGTINEEFTVKKKTSLFNEIGFIPLTPNEIVAFQDNLRSKLPLSVFESFIFDGEKIGRIIEDNEIHIYIKEMFYSIFNIELFDSLNTDLLSYFSSDKNSQKLSSLQIELMKSVNDEKLLISKIKNFEKFKESIHSSIENIKEEISSIHKKITQISGVSSKESKALRIELDNALKESESSNKDIKKYLEWNILFHQNNDILSNISAQIRKEQPIVNLQSAKRLFEYAKEKKFEINGISKLINELEAETNDIRNIHYGDLKLSDKCIARVDAADSEYRKVIESLKNLNNSELKLSKTKFSILENSDEIKELYEEIKEKKNQVAINYDKFNQVDEEISELKREFSRVSETIYTFKDRIKSETKLDASFEYSKKLFDASEKIKDKLIESRLEEIKTTLTDFFKTVIRKEDYIKSISIDKEYNISLYDNEGVEMDLSMLSAGETQLLIASIIYVMFKISGRRVPFIFDTPMARLDTQNRKNFAEKILKTISDQVIILSTDAEVVSDYYKILTGSIGEVNLLDYNEQKRATKILKGEYFK